MKKHIKFLLALLSMMCCLSVSLFSQEAKDIDIEETPIINNSMGLFFDADISLSLAGKVFTGQEVLFKYTFGNGIALDIGVRVLEDLIRHSDIDPLVYFSPVVDFNYKAFFIGGGPLLFSDNDKLTCIFLARTGGNFGNFQWGKAQGHVKVAFELSATIYGFDSNANNEDNLGTQVGKGLATILGTTAMSIINFPKIQVGVSCDLPF